ncbi:hypothetical protein AX15_000360 [Amanita polypyramis BW_CC]|nr:hypothetical protein AX15_000360 [Amanita polypyramis BW_CC]
MFFDLNVPIDLVQPIAAPSTSKKQKGKTPQQPQSAQIYNAAQIATIESRIDLLVHLGYTVLAFTQTIYKNFDVKTHVNVLDTLIPRLRPRSGILYLKRLNIILDEDSEKGFGLINANTTHFLSYDILSLTPTNATTFSLACLTHTVPSPLTAHIISLPLTLPRFNFYLKHTLIRTALKNGAAFEITYAGSLGAQHDAVLADAGFAEAGQNAKRNWWANAREVVRVTKGKGFVTSSGVANEADLRAPRDIQNLITLLGIPQDLAHHALTSTPKSITIRAQTRRTYRAVLSEPKAVIPEGSMDVIRSLSSAPASAPQAVGTSFADTDADDTIVQIGAKRSRESDEAATSIKNPDLDKPKPLQVGQIHPQTGTDEPVKKKKRKRNSKPLESSVG